MYSLEATFVCPTENWVLRFWETFKENVCKIVGCVVDSHFTYMEYYLKPRKKGGLGNMKITYFLMSLSKMLKNMVIS